VVSRGEARVFECGGPSTFKEFVEGFEVVEDELVVGVVRRGERLLLSHSALQEDLSL
jgi:intein/homing endonuclease